MRRPPGPPPRPFRHAPFPSYPGAPLSCPNAPFVMPGLVPGIHTTVRRKRRWEIPGTSPGMTARRHDEGGVRAGREADRRRCAGRCSRNQTFFLEMLDIVNARADIGREGRERHPRGAAFSPGSRRREKAVEKRTGEVCPAPASRARAIRRANRAGANARGDGRGRAGAIRAQKGSRRRTQAGRQENGTERNKMRWKDRRQHADRRGNRLSSCPERPANTAPVHKDHDKT